MRRGEAVIGGRRGWLYQDCAGRLVPAATTDRKRRNAMSKPRNVAPQVLKLSRETIQDLTPGESDGAMGGQCGSHHVCPPKYSKDHPNLCRESNLCPATNDHCPIILK